MYTVYSPAKQTKREYNFKNDSRDYKIRDRKRMKRWRRRRKEERTKRERKNSQKSRSAQIAEDGPIDTHRALVASASPRNIQRILAAGMT